MEQTANTLVTGPDGALYVVNEYGVATPYNHLTTEQPTGATATSTWRKQQHQHQHQHHHHHQYNQALVPPPRQQQPPLHSRDATKLSVLASPLRLSLLDPHNNARNVEPPSDAEIAAMSRRYNLFGFSIPSQISDQRVDYAPLIPVSVYVCRTTVVQSRRDPSVTEFRRRVARAAGGITHIELSFKFSKAETRLPTAPVWSVSSTAGRTVQLIERDVSGDAYNPVKGEWSLTELSLTEVQRHRAWVFSQAQCGKPYNTWGVYAFAERYADWVPSMRWFFQCFCPGVSDGSRYFCSQLILDTLAFVFYDDPHRLEIIRRIPAHMATPGDAMAIIAELNIMSGIVSTPGDEDAMMDALERSIAAEDSAILRGNKSW